MKEKKEKKDGAKKGKVKAKSAKEEEKTEEDGGFMGFMGIFDGPSDYGRAPYPPAHPTFGHWDWPHQPSSYHQQGSYPYPDGSGGGYGRRPSQGPNLPYAGSYGTNPQQYSGPSPPNDHQPRPEKRVHFDYGRDHGPAADNSRYWDRNQGPGSYQSRPHYSHDKYYTPGLSEWYGSYPGRSDDRAGYGQPPPAFEPAGGRQPPPVGHPPVVNTASESNQQLPHYRYSPYHPGNSTYKASQPSPGAQPPWMAAQPVQQWPGYPMHGAPPAIPPGYYHPQTPAYPRYGGMPPFQNAVSGSQSIGTNDNAQAQGPNPKPGSLDPAKDENNPDEKNDTDTNQTDNAVEQGGWGTDNNDSQNQNNDGWSTTDNNQNGDANWENQSNKDNADCNNFQDSNNNTAWENNGGNQSGDSGWDNKPNNSTQETWGSGNNNSMNPTGGEDHYRKVSGASQTSGASVRPLYGPHGAYYAMQFSTAPEVACDAEEEPRYDVPQAWVDDNGSTKQVQPGPGYLYWKKQSHPEYIDNLEEPYARFVFQYRTKDEISKELSINLDTEPSGNPEVQTFQNMPKDDLIQMLIRAKGALGGRIPSPQPKSTTATEENTFKGVPIEPPKPDFPTYDIPLRGGHAGRESKGGTSGGKGNSGAWDASANNTNSASNDSWAKRSNNNNDSNSNNASGGNDRWGAGGDSWENSNGGNTNNTTNNTGGSWDADPKNEYPDESWKEAKKQQQSGPPPAPPPRTDNGTGGGWAAEGTGGSGQAPANGW